MSPSTGLYFVAVVVVGGLALVAAAAVMPGSWFSTLESVSAKRFLLGIIGLNLIAVAFYVYYLVVLPHPARLTVTLMIGVLIPFITSILLAAGRPEEFRIEPQPEGGCPKVVFRFGGFDLPAVIIVGMFLWFLRALWLGYPAQYRAWNPRVETD